MSKPVEAQTALRSDAERHIEYGCCMFFRAFNMTNDPKSSWAFQPDVHTRVEALLRELVCVFRDSDIRLQPIGAAKRDDAFQGFMQRTLKKPRRMRATGA